MDVDNTLGREIQTIFRFYSSRRLWTGIAKGVLIKNSFLIWHNGISEELNFAKNVSESIVLRLSPIVYEGWALQRPKIGVHKVF